MTLFKTIVADPPWHETGGGKICRGAQKHYSVVKDAEIFDVIKNTPCWMPAADCHLWLWVTNNRLPLGLDIMARLGFRYVTNLCWVKTGGFGIGQYLRGQHELCLFGVRGGTMMPPVRNVPSVVTAPRGEHSAKPDAAFAAIERVSPQPRLEMFARRERAGWTVFGNEVETLLLP